MVQNLHAWLIANPITRDILIAFVVGLLILFLTPALSQPIETFWRFWSIPPQRINIWLLKARLSSAEHRRYRLRRMQRDMRYFVLHCVEFAFTLGGTVILLSLCIFMSVTRIVPLYGWPFPRSAHMAAIDVGLAFAMGYAALVLSRNQLNEIRAAANRPEKEEVRLSIAIEKIKGKLRLKGADMPELPATHNAEETGLNGR